MLRLSKKTDYALMALSYLASEAPGGTASAREIAKRYDIPLELLAKVLQHLARRGFVASHKGVHGGYYLARSTQAISIADVVEAIDGPLAITACGSDHDRCDQFKRCNVRDPLSRVKDRIAAALQAFSLSEMVNGRQPLTVRIGEPR